MSNEMWTAIIIAFFVGLAVGYLILLTTNASAKKQQKLESDLKHTNAQLQKQQQQLETHFETSATLLTTLAEDYKKLYAHLAQSSQTLLSETNKTLTLFPQTMLTEKTETKTTETKEEKEQQIAEAKISETSNDSLTTKNETEITENNTEQQPKDYTEGSSGILKS